MKVASTGPGSAATILMRSCTLTPRWTTATCFRCAGMAGTAMTGSVSLSFAARQERRAIAAHAARMSLPVSHR